MQITRECMLDAIQEGDVISPCNCKGAKLTVTAVGITRVLAMDEDRMFEHCVSYNNIARYNTYWVREHAERQAKYEKIAREKKKVYHFSNGTLGL